MARVLIIEQCAAIRELVAATVAGLGHEPLPVDPRTATEVPGADLVLVEPELPQARRLVARFLADFPGVPVVAVTSDPDGLASLAGIGPVIQLEKPFRLDDLRRVIASALGETTDPV